MIIIKHNGIEISCTDVDEAVELIKKLTNTTTIIQPGITPDIPWPQNPITSPTVTWDKQIDQMDDRQVGINECHTNLPDDVDNVISKINSVDNTIGVINSLDGLNNKEDSGDIEVEDLLDMSKPVPPQPPLEDWEKLQKEMEHNEPIKPVDYME